MSMLMQALLEGVINGLTLTLVAMGIVSVWGVMDILSFTQGEFLMITMPYSFYFNLYFGLGSIISLLTCMVIMSGIGFIVYKPIIARVLKGPVLSQRLATFALSVVLVSLALLLLSGDFRTISEVAINGSIDLGFMVLSKQKIVPFVISVCVASFIFLFLSETRTGKAIRIAPMDKIAADSVGISLEKTYVLVFGLSAAIAGAAGCTLTHSYYIYSNVEANFQLSGFTAVVAGSSGSIPGVFSRGLTMGLADSPTGVYMDTAFRYVGICVMFLLLAQFKPKGLFGGKQI